MLVSAIAVLMLLATWAGKANRQAQAPGLRMAAEPACPGLLLAGGAAAGGAGFLGHAGRGHPFLGPHRALPYIPLLNPTDLTLALGAGRLVFWRRVLVTAAPAPAGSAWATGRNALVALALLVFIAVNTVLAAHRPPFLRRALGCRCALRQLCGADRLRNLAGRCWR